MLMTNARGANEQSVLRFFPWTNESPCPHTLFIISHSVFVNTLVTVILVQLVCA